MTEHTLLGVGYGLLSAFLWGIGSVALKPQVGKLGPLGIIAGRSLFGCLFYLIAFAIRGDWSELSALGWKPLLALLFTVLIGFILAEGLFMASLKRAPVSQVTPIFWSYPVITSLLAWLALGEKLSLLMVAGALLVVAGVSLVSLDTRVADPLADSKHTRQGLLMAVGSALMWGVGGAVVKVGVVGGSALAVSAWLIWINMLFLSILPSKLPRLFHLFASDSRFLLSIAVAGMIGGPGFANLFYVLSVSAIGAGQAAVLGATAPLFTALLAILFLKERFDYRQIAGTCLVVIGVALNIFQ